MKIQGIIVLSLILLASCGFHVNESKEKPMDKLQSSSFNVTNIGETDWDLDTFYLPLDTASILKKMDIKLNKSVKNLTDYNDLDTFYLNYVAYACDCQRWVVSDNFFNDSTDSFVLDDHGYFIHPFDKEIELDESIYAFNNKVMFVGKVHIDNDYYTQSEIPQKKQILTYYAYEVILPITVYGPLYHTGLKEVPSSVDELLNRAVLEIGVNSMD